MVKSEIDVEGKKLDLYMDNNLYKNLTTKVKPNVNKKDKDWVLIVDGEEGSGKSVLAGHIGKILDPDLNLNRICFTHQEFTKSVVKAKKGQCVIFDEAFTGLSSRSSLSEVNRLIVSLMMEMRQKNLFIIIVMPSFFLLDKYVALWRAKGLIHVYTKSGKRGYWAYFNRQKKKLLYLKGKQTYTYSFPKVRVRGRFLDQYVVNENEYRKRKKEALHKKNRNTKQESYKGQRDIAVTTLMQETGYSLEETSKVLTNNGWKIKKVAIFNLKKQLDQAKIEQEELEQAIKDENSLTNPLKQP